MQLDTIAPLTTNKTGTIRKSNSEKCLDKCGMMGHQIVSYLMKGVGLLNSHLTTLHHWLHFKGKSRWLLIHLEKYGHMTVSLVGRIAIGASRSDFPDLVTHATWMTNEKVTD